MTLAELDETTAILGTLLTALSGTLAGATGTSAADLFYAIGDLQATAETTIRAGALGAPLLAAFDLAFAAGASIANLELVRLAMLAETPVSLSAIALTNAGIQLALAEEVKVLAATTFTSRGDVDAALSVLNQAFDQAEEYAADNHAPAVYQALIGAHAAAVRDLTSRARPLPNLVTYRFARVMTSHALAQRLYGDASRCDELVAENKIIAPAFCPPVGRALSS